MSLFGCLVVCHLFGDFLIQTQFEALNKALGRFWNRALVAHCVKYTLCFIPALVRFHLSPVWLLLIYVSHMILDRRWPVIWWRKNIMHDDDEGIKATFWLTIVVDQIFHLLILVVIVTYSL